jgi:hypothetical protein
MIESLEGYIKDTHEPPRHEHHIDEQSIEQQEQQTVAIAESEASEAEPNMSSSSAEYARINAQFNNIATNVPVLPIPAQPQHPHTPRAAALNTPRPVPQAPQQQQQPQQPQQQRYFNIYDKIIHSIDGKFFIKISFRELKAYASAITFNRDVDEEQVDKLFASIKDGYHYPFTMDAIYDKTVNIGENSIKIINGNHRHAAICKYIAEHDKDFSCDYMVFMWISVVDECESTNLQQSIELYTMVNNHLPFKEPINVSIDAMKFVEKLCSLNQFKGKIKTQKGNDTSHQPRIHKNELYKLLEKNKDILEEFVSTHSVNRNNLIITEDILNKFIESIKDINHRISLKEKYELYSHNKLVENNKYYEEAVDIGLYLNLKNSNFPKEMWIKHLCDPSSI